MITRQRQSYSTDSKLTDLTAANFAQQTRKITLDRTWPIEEIVISVQATVANALTTMVGLGFLNILKRINISVNDGEQPRSVVDVSGGGLLQFVNNAGYNLDPATNAVLLATNAEAIISGAILRVNYRIPFVHPMITEPLRSRMLLPVHIYRNDPVLQLDFSAAAEMFSGVADPFSAIVADVHIVRREVPASMNKRILDSGGYIASDLIETENTLATSLSNSLVRMEVPAPGWYTGLTIYQLKGNSNLQPRDMSANTTLGQETQWRLEVGKSVLRDWRMKHVQTINSFTRSQNLPWGWNLWGGSINSLTSAAVTGGAPPIWVTAKSIVAPAGWGGTLAAGQIVQEPSSIHLDFLADQQGDVNELGSLLDCNLAAQSGLKMEVITTLSSGSSQTSKVNFVGHRLFGDLSKWQTLAA